MALPVPIVAAAPTAPSAMPLSNPDSKLLALADEYVIAEQRYSDLAIVVDRMNERTDPPEVLRIRPSDLELGRSPSFDKSDGFWQRPCDLDQWRRLDEWEIECTKTEDRMEMVQWRVPASDELKARAAEIVTAFDAWCEKRPRGYKKAGRELARAEKAYLLLEAEVANTRALTIDGMRAKIRCARAWEREEIGSISGGCAEAMALSIFRDLEQLGSLGSDDPDAAKQQPAVM
jgi:hypothetical protein